jgi:DNA-binding response OmpR family regulator
VVVVSGYGSEADRWRSCDAGADLHLTKPADPRALVRLLARIRDDLTGVPPAVHPS